MKRHFYLLSTVVLILPFFPMFQTAYASDLGLRIENHKVLMAEIAELRKNAIEFGLQEEVIRAKVELQLRRNGINPNPNTGVWSGRLWVEILVFEEAFGILVQYKRPVLISSRGKNYEGVEGVWHRWLIGKHGNKISFILEALTDYIDIFINEYLKANQK